jgi:hypothetical protein
MGKKLHILFFILLSTLFNLTQTCYAQTFGKTNRYSLRIIQNSKGEWKVIDFTLNGKPGKDVVKAQKAAIEQQVKKLAQEKLNELGLDGKKSEKVYLQTEDGGEFYVKEMTGAEWLETIGELGSSVWEI